MVEMKQIYKQHSQQYAYLLYVVIAGLEQYTIIT